MEPGIFSQLKRYFQSGGNPLQVIEELSQNYTAVAQMANLIAEWLIIGGRMIFCETEKIISVTFSKDDCNKIRKIHIKRTKNLQLVQSFIV